MAANNDQDFNQYVIIKITQQNLKCPTLLLLETSQFLASVIYKDYYVCSCQTWCKNGGLPWYHGMKDHQVSFAIEVDEHLFLLYQAILLRFITITALRCHVFCVQKTHHVSVYHQIRVHKSLATAKG